ncbi:hypothetical protein PVL29_014439 [Vitis rotundifolia]|uniref:Major facilitator superfamily (MFS) profile domain-containing protein n=1 Tax=Vitis rotundifolia TaxID=103349 RepID=A0AA38ZH85_VITRO|nr:hypothetical protein PVL29_014439 [Vitis rotundifolia]
MAKFAFSTENICCFPRHTNSLFNNTSLKHRQLLIFSSKQRSQLRIFSAIRGKESVTETESVITGLLVDELDNSASASDAESQEEGGEVGFDWNWPPWKNLPQRYKLIGTTSLAFVVCNMDKVNLSIAIIPMSHQFGWNSSTAGLVQSSFFWGYALSQLPGGWLAKIFGGRKVLEIGVLTWSLATALVPVLAGFMPGLVLSRILVGIGEGVSPSAATDLIARSIPLEERSRAVAFVFGGLSVGSVTGLLMAPPLIQNFGWEAVFYIFGILGIAWFLGFQFVKEEQPSFVADLISWSRTISSKKSLNTSLKDLGASLKVSVLPPLASIFVTTIASQLADNLIANGVETTTVRKICQTIAFLSPAVCMTLSSLDLGLPPWEIVGILTGGLALSSFALSGLYCTHQDMSPEYASILLGITNTVGAVPGIVGVALTGYLLDSTHSWSLSLFAPSIFFYLTGTIVWLAFASSKPQSFSKID